MGDAFSAYNLSSPTRRLQADTLFANAYGNDSEANLYNAYEKDIAVVHFFFEDSVITNFRK